MRTSSISRKIGGLPFAVGLTFSIAGLITVLSAPLVYAQSTPTGGATSGQSGGQSGGEQYKRGETPTGQQYGIIKEGEPHKSDAGKKMDRSDDKQRAKRDGKSGGGLVDRDKRETHE
jgi:hypothetical protein